MALAYSRRRITSDIDAVFEPKTIVHEEARKRADDIEGLPSDWLNVGVKGLAPDLAPPELATETFSSPGISVGIASAEYMFAMKASAARSEVDRDDIRTLIDELGITSVDHAFAILRRHYSPNGSPRRRSSSSRNSSRNAWPNEQRPRSSTTDLDAPGRRRAVPAVFVQSVPTGEVVRCGLTDSPVPTLDAIRQAVASSGPLLEGDP